MTVCDFYETTTPAKGIIEPGSRTVPVAMTILSCLRSGAGDNALAKLQTRTGNIGRILLDWIIRDLLSQIILHGTPRGVTPRQIPAAEARPILNVDFLPPAKQIFDGVYN